MPLDDRPTRTPDARAHGAPPEDAASDWSERIHRLLGVPTTDGNEVRVLRNGDEIFPAMLDAIDHARSTIDLVTFVYWSGDVGRRFAERLADAARRGCRVRVLLDSVGARRMDDALVETMRSAGCDVRMFRPFLDDPVPEIGTVNHRTHRKLLVCDGGIGFTGGVGIADEWSGDARDETEWRDTHVAVRGPAVGGLMAGFTDNWADEDDHGFDARFEQPLASEPRPGGSTCAVVRGSSTKGANDISRLMRMLIQLARHRLRITTAYFNPGDGLLDDLCGAVARGVEVQLLVPGEHADKRFVQMNGEGHYQRLLDAGLDLRSYERTMLHAKIVTVDGEVATIGSTNLNQRSTQLDEECNLVIVDPDAVAVFDRHFDDDLAHTVVLDPERWADRSLVQRVGERLTGLADRWL